MDTSTGKYRVITERIVLDRVQINYSQVVAAVSPMLRRRDPERLAAEDAIIIGRMVEGWGRACRVELSCPTTWWQHLKLALRKRWPRLFGRFVVRMRTAVAENGAIVAGLAPVLTNHLVIPYSLPTGFRDYTDDPSREDEW